MALKRVVDGVDSPSQDMSLLTRTLINHRLMSGLAVISRDITGMRSSSTDDQNYDVRQNLHRVGRGGGVNLPPVLVGCPN